MGIDRVFHLDAGDILAAADDDVFLAVNNEQVVVCVEIAQIAGAEEAAVGKGRRGRLVILPVAAEIGDRSDADLAHFTIGKFIAGIIQNAQIDHRF